MVTTLRKTGFAELRPGIKAPAKETILTPRFYTTDFDAMAAMDIRANEEELRAILREFQADYNRHHFVRDEEFNRSWDHIEGETRRLFIEFLERSCTAEFSGFLLYKELSRKLKDKNPVLAECFALMSRDEARHAGFLNKAMADFGLSLDLGFLTSHRSYTFFAPKFIFYATYLSEKIGYWRYITIYRHLEKHPEHRIYPIFKFFESWCQDENRHGDFFDAILRANPQFLNGWKARLWCRFFLLSVFATMYLNDQQRAKFYAAIGLDARSYDLEVIRKTNWTAGRVFPVILNVEHPQFEALMDACAAHHLQIVRIGEGGGPKLWKRLRQLPHVVAIAWNLLRLYLMRPVDMEAQRGMVY
jgi:magnesium-protoporphyrin IX monomethyl ester (oxidative) cyclase